MNGTYFSKEQNEIKAHEKALLDVFVCVRKHMKHKNEEQKEENRKKLLQFFAC